VLDNGSNCMSVDAAALRRDGVYQATAPITELLTDLAAIEKIVSQERTTCTNLRWAALACFLAGVAFVMVHAAFIVTGIVAAVVCLIYSVTRSRALRANSDRGALLAELLTVLRQDSSPKARYFVELYFKSREKVVSEEPWTARKKSKQQYLTDQWMSMDGQLLDGASFRQTFESLLRRRTFINSNGKRKTKTRTRFLITIKLSHSSEIFGDPQTVYRSLRNAVRLPATAKLKGIEFTRDAIAAKAVVNTPADLKQADLMLLLGIYRILNLSRQLAAKGRPQ